MAVKQKTCEKKAGSLLETGNHLKQTLSECPLTLWAMVWTMIELGAESLGRGFKCFKHGPTVLL